MQRGGRPTKRRAAGIVPPGDRGSIRLSMGWTPGRQARKRSATDWSVMDSYRAVKMPATSRKGLSKPQYKKTTRKSCSGVLTFLGLTNALNSRAICTVAGGRSCKSSSKSVSGSVKGNGMGRFSCQREGKIFTSMQYALIFYDVHPILALMPVGPPRLASSRGIQRAPGPAVLGLLESDRGDGVAPAGENGRHGAYHPHPGEQGRVRADRRVPVRRAIVPDGAPVSAARLGRGPLPPAPRAH